MRIILSFFLVVALGPSAAWAQVGLGDDSSTFGRTIHVHSTGDPIANAAALTAALGSAIVTDRVDPALEPVLIQIGPGLFDFGAAITFMPENVGLRGAGTSVTFSSTTLSCTGCLAVLVSEGTVTDGSTNWFSDFNVVAGEGDNTIVGINGAIITLNNIFSRSGFGAGLDGPEAFAFITNSFFDSSFDDAFQMFNEARGVVKGSIFGGSDISGDGVIYGSGSAVPELPELTVYHSSIDGGATDPWPGTLTCAYIADVTGEIDGCPPPPPAPVGASGSAPASGKGGFLANR